jgi:hypothetical protein
MARVRLRRRIDTRARILYAALVGNEKTYDDLTQIEKELLGAYLSEKHNNNLLKIDPEKPKTRRRRPK